MRLLSITNLERATGMARTNPTQRDTFDISNRAALNKLDELHERGEIERKEVGARAVIWWK